MTVEVAVDNQTRIIEVKASGKLTADDYVAFEPAVVDQIKASGKIRILFIMHDFHGWDVKGVWEDIKFSTAHFCNGSA
jgi:hypothetical protein